LERFISFFVPHFQNNLERAKKLVDLLHLTPLPCIKFDNFDSSLQSHTIIGTFSSPIRICRHGVSWNDPGFLDLTTKSIAFTNIFSLQMALNIDRFRVPIRAKNLWTSQKLPKSGDHMTKI
jgi:hypothetical protein